MEKSPALDLFCKLIFEHAQHRVHFQCFLALWLFADFEKDHLIGMESDSV